MFCCVYGCNSDSEVNPHLSFHQFPLNRQQAKAWEIRIRRQNFEATKHTYVCSRHFSLEDFSEPRQDTPEQFRKVRLKRGAIPSLNLRGEEEAERLKKRSTKTSLNAMTPASDHRPCKINIPVCSPMLYSDAGGATEEIATEADESCQVHSYSHLSVL